MQCSLTLKLYNKDFQLYLVEYSLFEREIPLEIVQLDEIDHYSKK